MANDDEKILKICLLDNDDDDDTMTMMMIMMIVKTGATQETSDIYRTKIMLDHINDLEIKKITKQHFCIMQYTFVCVNMQIISPPMFYYLATFTLYATFASFS